MSTSSLTSSLTSSITSPLLRGAAGGAANPVVGSLDFNGTAQYLSQSDANFGAITATKFAIALSFRLDTLAATAPIYTKWDTAAGGQRSFRLSVGASGNIIFISSQDGTATAGSFNTNAATITTATWYGVLIHYDSAAVAGDRIKMWINGSAVTASAYTAPTAGIFDGTLAVAVGSDASAAQFADGLIYSATFFDNVLPAAADVFDGTAGKLKNLSAISGLKSLLTGSTAVDDFLLADWTNNGTVTTSATVP